MGLVFSEFRELYERDATKLRARQGIVGATRERECSGSTLGGTVERRKRR